MQPNAVNKSKPHVQQLQKLMPRMQGGVQARPQGVPACKGPHLPDAFSMYA